MVFSHRLTRIFHVSLFGKFIYKGKTFYFSFIFSFDTIMIYFIYFLYFLYNQEDLISHTNSSKSNKYKIKYLN